MADFKIEKYEWDDLWMEDTLNRTGKRVFHIGDSISRGLRGPLNRMGAGEWLFDNFASSKAVDNPWLEKAALLFAEQLPGEDVLLINNGLHGFHIEDGKEYPALYKKFVLALTAAMPAAKPVLLLSSYLAKKETNDRVLVRNEGVKRIGEALGIPVWDLYTVSKEQAAHQTDGCHFDDEGNREMAEWLLGELKKL